MSRRTVEITPELVLRAYRYGLFPMAESRDGDRLFWLDPERRGVLPLHKFHLSRRLLRTVLSDQFVVTSNTDFGAAIAGCAMPVPGRMETWINPQIERLFCTLHGLGHAHSVECYRDGELVGGLYGVSVGGAFFGESMFSRARDASKVALVHLVARLRLGKYQLLDTQFTTEHLGQFGVRDLPRELYKERLAEAVETQALWLAAPGEDQLRQEFATIAAEGKVGGGGPAAEGDGS